MPSIEDYAHAKCSLFRTPPIDFTGIESKLKGVIVEQWQKGYSASNAVDGLLNDTGIAGELTRQVAESLAFQRRVTLEGLKDESKKTTKNIKNEQKEAVNEVDEQYRLEIEQAEKQTEALQEEQERKRNEHSMTENSVNEMRDRVQRSLGNIGGERNLATLFQINQELLGERKPEVGKTPKVYERVKRVEEALKSSLPVTAGSVPQNKEYKSYIQKKREHTFLGKILRLFDYEIW